MSFFDVIYQNADLIAINKPANTSFHNEENSVGLVNQLRQELDTQLWPVHRLDKMTSGTLLFAKSKNAAASLSVLFSQRKINKIYWAISDRKPKKKQGKIIGDMEKSRSGNWKLMQSYHNPAETRFHSCSLIPGIRFFWLQPKTGKTHQLRVALKAISSPILGDARYQGSAADRGYLHAYQIAFNWKGENISIQCMPNNGQYFLMPELKNCLDKFLPDSSKTTLSNPTLSK